MNAGTLRRVRAQARFDLTTSLRNGEQVLVTLILPAVILVGLARTSLVSASIPGGRIAAIAPGVLAMAVISSAFTGQAIGTAFDRRAGALRLLALTPLGRSGLILGRVLALVGLELVQVGVLSALAVGLGWRPAPGSLLLLGLALMLGTVTFCSLGLLLAGTARAEAVLAVANLIWVLLVSAGSVVIAPPASGFVNWLALVLPSGAFGALARAASVHGIVDVPALVVLAVWGAAGVAATMRWFRWD